MNVYRKIVELTLTMIIIFIIVCSEAFAIELNPFDYNIEGYTRIYDANIRMSTQIITRSKEYEIVKTHFPEVYRGCQAEDLNFFVPVDPSEDIHEFKNAVGIYNVAFTCLSFENPYCKPMHFYVIINYSSQVILFSDCNQMADYCNTYRNKTVSVQNAIETFNTLLEIERNDDLYIGATFNFFGEHDATWTVNVYTIIAPYSLIFSNDAYRIAYLIIDAFSGEILDYGKISLDNYNIFFNIQNRDQ